MMMYPVHPVLEITTTVSVIDAIRGRQDQQGQEDAREYLVL